jgi:hypothetical protein
MHDLNGGGLRSSAPRKIKESGPQSYLGVKRVSGRNMSKIKQGL